MITLTDTVISRYHLNVSEAPNRPDLVTIDVYVAPQPVDLNTLATVGDYRRAGVEEAATATVDRRALIRALLGGDEADALAALVRAYVGDDAAAVL